jgi:hypothetical protein
MRNVTLCLIATWIAISALTSSAQAATFGSSAWWQQMDSVNWMMPLPSSTEHY